MVRLLYHHHPYYLKRELCHHLTIEKRVFHPHHSYRLKISYINILTFSSLKGSDASSPHVLSKKKKRLCYIITIIWICVASLPFLLSKRGDISSPFLLSHHSCHLKRVLHHPYHYCYLRRILIHHQSYPKRGWKVHHTYSLSLKKK